jgi:hypothetical protein
VQFLEEEKRFHTAWTHIGNPRAFVGQANNPKCRAEQDKADPQDARDSH